VYGLSETVRIVRLILVIISEHIQHKSNALADCMANVWVSHPIQHCIWLEGDPLPLELQEQVDQLKQMDMASTNKVTHEVMEAAHMVGLSFDAMEVDKCSNSSMQR
jgi:hypothetical protein